jgi:hypothetical protein
MPYFRIPRRRLRPNVTRLRSVRRRVVRRVETTDLSGLIFYGQA